MVCCFLPFSASLTRVSLLARGERASAVEVLTVCKIDLLPKTDFPEHIASSPLFVNLMEQYAKAAMESSHFLGPKSRVGLTLLGQVPIMVAGAGAQANLQVRVDLSGLTAEQCDFMTSRSSMAILGSSDPFASMCATIHMLDKEVDRNKPFDVPITHYTRGVRSKKLFLFFVFSISAADVFPWITRLEVPIVTSPKEGREYCEAHNLPVPAEWASQKASDFFIKFADPDMHFLYPGQQVCVAFMLHPTRS